LNRMCVSSQMFDRDRDDSRSCRIGLKDGAELNPRNLRLLSGYGCSI
jgi:hypothetical protein